jgi:hypothetical protein
MSDRRFNPIDWRLRPPDSGSTVIDGSPLSHPRD